MVSEWVPSDEEDTGTRPIQKMYLYASGRSVQSIQLEYLLLDGSTKLRERHGNTTGDPNVISFDESEVLTGLEGGTYGSYIYQITFLTYRQDGSNARYGPFGMDSQKCFSVYGNVMGFSGNVAEAVNGISVYYI